MSKFYKIQRQDKIPISFSILSLLFILSGCGGSSGEGSQSILVVSNNKPIISITSPIEGGNQSKEEATTFIATANDVEDGDISSNINWSSNMDGNLGIGAQLSLFLSPGDHLITAEILDSDINSSQDAINYTINASNHGKASLSWSAPLENTDDSKLTDLAGFTIYYGDTEDQLPNSVTIYSPNTLTVVIEDLRTEQLHYFAVTAFNVLGVESELSNIASLYLER